MGIVLKHKSVPNHVHWLKWLAQLLRLNNLSNNVSLINSFCNKKIKQHKVTIGVDQSLSNSKIYEHKCLENINKLYKTSGKCNDQKQ